MYGFSQSSRTPPQLFPPPPPKKRGPSCSSRNCSVSFKLYSTNSPLMLPNPPLPVYPVPEPGSETRPGTGTGDPDEPNPESNGAKTLIVYRRNKRLKRAANANFDNNNASNCCNLGGKVVINDETEGNSGIVEVEVKEESTLTVKCGTTATNGRRKRFTRSVLKLNVEPLIENSECGEVHDSSNGVGISNAPMEIPKKISITGGLVRLRSFSRLVCSRAIPFSTMVARGEFH